MKDNVEDELLAMETTKDSQLTQDQAPPSKRPKQSSGAVSKLLGDLFEVSASAPLYSEAVTKEMELYKTEQLLELDSDPLQCWHESVGIKLIVIHDYYFVLLRMLS